VQDLDLQSRRRQLDAAILRKPFGVDELLTAIRAATGTP